MSDARYGGTDNLETMTEAVNYNRALVALIVQHARRGDRILDFGAGIGTFARAVADAGYAVECVERDAEQRRILTAHGLRAHGDIAEIPDAGIDFAYSLNVLEHIDDDVAAIRALARTLCPGGRLLIYVPAFPLLYTSMDRKVGHVRRYRQRDLRTKVAAAGLTVTKAQYVDSLGFLATLVYRAFGSASGDIDRNALRTYDRLVFPVSAWLDRALNQVLGKNVLLIAVKRTR